MIVADEINHRVQKLPEPLRAEVLHFVEYLLMRSEERQEDRAWSGFSLRSATREDDGEPGPDYSEDDLKEPYS